jgi:hypothetical protein
MTTFTTQDRQDAQRTPLDIQQIAELMPGRPNRNFTTEEEIEYIVFARAIERAHGIGE